MANLNTDILTSAGESPSLPVQQRIASVLGAFDDLIDTNRDLAFFAARALQPSCALWAPERCGGDR
ncbi:MAG: hypothetical protein V9E82_15910 [Candidatus Nanopelagicales bacterium]